MNKEHDRDQLEKLLLRVTIMYICTSGDGSLYYNINYTALFSRQLAANFKKELIMKKHVKQMMKHQHWTSIKDPISVDTAHRIDVLSYLECIKPLF